MAVHPGDQVMTMVNFALIHHKSLPDPFWSWEVLSGLLSLIRRHVRFVKSGSIPLRLIYHSLSIWMKNRSCSYQDSLDRALKYKGAQRECRFEENSSCTACCCLWQYPGELCNRAGFFPRYQCINQPAVSLYWLSQFSCLLFSHMRITDGKL